ncbi:putative leader peptide [Streptomyces sp. NPDC085946]
MRTTAGRTEVRHVRQTSHHPALNPRRVVRLHSRPHIDLQRVAGALCRP